MSLIRSVRFIQTAFYILGILAIFGQGVAYAQEDAETIDILPAKSLSEDIFLATDEDETHPPVRLTPDKSELIHLDKNAKTIVVGNPDHLSVLADNAKTLVLVPKMPGATHFTVLDEDSNVIMQRHVIVASPKERYVRVRRSCAATEDDDCQETSVFYCPDMCHEINVMVEKSEDSPASADSAEALTEATTAGEEDNGDE